MIHLSNKDRLNLFVDGYKNTINKNYKHIEEHFNETFPIIKFEKYLESCLIKVDRALFGYDYYYLIVDNYKFNKEIYDFTEIDDKLKRILVDFNKRDRIEKLISDAFPEFSNKHAFYLYKIIIDTEKNLYNNGGFAAEKDYNNWKKEKSTPLKKYNHDTISPYSHLDYDGLIQTFYSERYNEDFSYQMEQAEECYKRKLYLPAAATLSVALETVLMAICEKENVNLKTKETTDTMMNYLGERLLQEKVINYRMHKRIDVTYSLRNSVSHSNPGEVSKADCQIILSCIKVLIDEHYSK